MKLLEKAAAERKAAAKDIVHQHVKLQKGNRKTGHSVYTVSLLPVIDCPNCTKCCKDCYDLRHDIIMPTVLKDRARNSAIHAEDPGRFWAEVAEEVVRKRVRFLRINVGGDLKLDDFWQIDRIAVNCPQTEFLFFTKNYKELNQYIAGCGWLPGNVHAIVSRWPGMRCSNPYHLPEAYVRFKDREGTYPAGAIRCSGNCSDCAETKNGCFGLARYQAVVFDQH